ncbi:MAG: efflux RND transporter permease subunit [Bacteroidia bacterium]
MWERILRASIYQPIFSLGLTLVIIGIGVYGILGLKVDAVPDITNNQVQVYTYAPQLSAIEIEQLITTPIERALATVPHKVEQRSISRMGLSLVTLVFSDEVDIYWARAQIQEKLLTLQGELPFGARPQMGPISTGLSEVYQYTLSAKSPINLIELRSIQDWVIRPALLEVEGVADVSSYGGGVRRWEIELHPYLLEKYGITLPDLMSKLQSANLNTGGGYVEKNQRAYYLRAEGMIQDKQTLSRVPVAYIGTTPIPLEAVGTVKEGQELRYGALIKDTEGEKVGGIVLMRKGENAAQVVARLKEKIRQLEPQLPYGITVEPFLDRSQLIQQVIQTVSLNLAEAALIVIAVAVIFLGSLRAGLIVGSVIPLSLIFALGVMRLLGESGNLISLGAIDFGLVVDGSIILVEAVLVGLSGGVSDRKARVLQSAIGIRQASMLGEIVILSIYLPLLFLSGVEGKMFRPMVLMMVNLLFGAMILSLTYVPYMSALFLKGGGQQMAGLHRFSHALYEGLEKVMRALWQRSLRHPLRVTGLFTFLFVGALSLFLIMEAEFLPQLDEGDFAVEIRLPIGSSLSQSIGYAGKISRTLIEALPTEIGSVIAKIGTSEIPMDPMFVENMDLIVRVLPNRTMPREALAESISTTIKKVYAGIFVGVQQPIQMRFNELLAGARTDIILRVLGPNLDTLTAIGEKIAALAEKIPGAADISKPILHGVPMLQVRWKRSQLAFYNVNLATASLYIQALSAGCIADKIRHGNQTWNLTLTLKNNPTLDHIGGLPIPTEDRKFIPLREVADISWQYAPAEISHYSGQKTYNLGINARGRAAVSVVEDLQNQIRKTLTLPPGYFLVYGGQWKNYQEARTHLSLLAGVILILIAMLLYITFGQKLKPVWVTLALMPLGLTGGIYALFFRGYPFSISAGIGLIAGAGIISLNGIVLINQVQRLEKAGYRKWHALHRALSSRVRPIFTTSLAAIVGFLPMAFSQQGGAEVQRALATTVIGCLTLGLAQSLIFLPTLYAAAHGYYKKQ